MTYSVSFIKCNKVKYNYLYDDSEVSSKEEAELRAKEDLKTELLLQKMKHKLYNTADETQLTDKQTNKINKAVEEYTAKISEEILQYNIIVKEYWVEKDFWLKQ